MIKEIQLNELLTGKAIQRGNSMFPKTADIVMPFVEKLQDYTQQWKIKVDEPTTLSMEEEQHGEITKVQTDNIFQRVLIQAVLHDEYQLIPHPGDTYSKVIGLVYALDVQKPIIKVYSGGLRDACINLSIFSKSAIQYRHFADEDFDAIYETIPGYLDAIPQEREEYREKVEFLMEDKLSGVALEQELGKLALRCIGKEPGMATHYNGMVKMLQSNRDYNGVKNLYFRDDMTYSRYDLWNGLTANITEKANFMAAPNMVYKAYSLFER